MKPPENDAGYIQEATISFCQYTKLKLLDITKLNFKCFLLHCHPLSLTNYIKLTVGICPTVIKFSKDTNF